MPEDSKPKEPYEPPEILDLGSGVAYAKGKKCKSGGAAGSAECQSGGSPSKRCQAGGTAYGGECKNGSVASGKCKAGNVPKAGDADSGRDAGGDGW